MKNQEVGKVLEQDLYIKQGLSRSQWIDACHFHDLESQEVLREVARRVSELRAQVTSKKTHPLVLLDLDSTLYGVEPRSHQILKEWRVSAESEKFQVTRKVMERLNSSHLGYSLKDTFSALGLSLEDPEVQRAWESAKRFWLDRFFTNEYLKYDIAYEGAADFARELHSLGAELVYLTGRDEPGMGEGTRSRLLQDGFPFQTERTHLLMKANFHLDDLEHKKNAAHYVRENGTLVASFENEPPNLVALYEIFPDAMHVFVDTIYSDRPAVPMRGLYRIRSFLKE